ncbi:UDP-N-acetyl glucosamine 2-epimerase [Haloarchaeobius iranensis]|uniref:UDP-N-acetylglucosamine 2-epimerase (Non-hydrolysing) n=1 Tax=Haloarchaeobius iranensis TaxID=996166 RepID=A0A1G9WLT3_9EURY|nr:UDP-N-acetylglucosamine 2-epimerase [Haloarchaeobius iranensis]SDM84995.1 UDP-N-acetylglucosamine 2-epimerase (non-hydrolysing) [Haloarchaeobius iranensis]
MSSAYTVHDDRLDARLADAEFAIAVVTATKPDFYKQAPVVTAADELGVPCFILHTGQHYDDLLGHGLAEYGVEDHIGVDLGVRGGLSQKTAEVTERVDRFTDYLDEHHPETTVVPLVHGDTHAAATVPQAWAFATGNKVAHNEAGLRGMAPDYDSVDREALAVGDDDAVDDFIDTQWDGDWHVDRSEPFPEQYDTFVGSAASLYHFAPVELNREHLRREGYPEERVPVVGNSVVDAIAAKREADLDESVFDVYPVLEERDDWLRVDIHRRANLLPGRFRAIVEGVISLVEDGYNVNFVELTATRNALEATGLRERLLELDETRANFLFTGLWKKHAHVYEFLESGQCMAEFTDSGSMQEELNHIDEAACLTARFNTDRPETVFEANTNLLVPPISGEFVATAVRRVCEDDALLATMRDGPALYGENVGRELVSFMDEHRDEPVEWSHERAGFDLGETTGMDYL